MTQSHHPEHTLKANLEVTDHHLKQWAQQATEWKVGSALPVGHPGSRLKVVLTYVTVWLDATDGSLGKRKQWTRWESLQIWRCLALAIAGSNGIKQQGALCLSLRVIQKD